MNVFVSGIAGFLASHLAERLIKEGNKVIGVDNLSGGSLENIPKGVKFYLADCANRERMYELMENVDLVYHCACVAHEGLSIFSPKFITDNTFGTSMSMISAAIGRGVKRFILCSSAARYGALQPPFTEDMQPKPQDPYGIAKYASDLVLQEMAQFYGIEYSIVVPHNIIGTRQKYDDPYRNVASIFINLMLQGRSPMIYGDGLQERSFSFVSDVVDPMVKMGTLPKANGEIFNVGPDQKTTTILELAQIIARLTDFKGKFLHFPNRPHEVRIVHLSADKARRILGYEPKRELEDGLKEMIAYIKKHGAKPFQYVLPVEIESPKMPKTWKNKLF